MIRIRRSKFDGRGRVPGQRVLSKPEPTRRQTKSDPPRSGLWSPGGESSSMPLRSMRQRYSGHGRALVVKRTGGKWNEYGRYEPTYEPVETISAKRGYVEVICSTDS